MPGEPRYRSINRVITALLSYPEEFVAHVADLLERQLDPQAFGRPASKRSSLLEEGGRTRASHTKQ